MAWTDKAREAAAAARRAKRVKDAAVKRHTSTMTRHFGVLSGGSPSTKTVGSQRSALATLARKVRGHVRKAGGDYSVSAERVGAKFDAAMNAYSRAMRARGLKGVALNNAFEKHLPRRVTGLYHVAATLSHAAYIQKRAKGLVQRTLWP